MGVDMSFTNKYPYSDFHELNNDWIIRQLQKVEALAADLKQLVYELEDAVDTMETDDIQSAQMLEGVSAITQAADNVAITFDRAVYDQGARTGETVSLTIPAADSSAAGVMTAAHAASISANTAAIQEHTEAIDTAYSEIGELSSLTTTDKDSLVGALNEVNAAAAHNASDIATLAHVAIFNTETSCTGDVTINFTQPVSPYDLLYVTLNTSAGNSASTRLGFFVLAGTLGFIPIQYTTNDGYYVRVNVTTTSLRIIATNATSLYINSILKV